MGKYAKSYFENPYLENTDEETKYSADVIMDEARQKWRAGGWRATSEAFELDGESLYSGEEASEDGEQTEEKAAAARPSAERFQLDITRDLTGDTISRKTLSTLDYSSSYRPRGDLEERITVRRGTLQRYDILAGDLEAPPEDMSFVTDAQARREREKQHGETHTGQLRRDTRRLDTSVEERRSEILRMLPVEEDRSAEILEEAGRRKRREYAEKGKKLEQKEKRRKVKLTGPVEDAPESVTVSRFDRMPEQNGMVESSIELPEFTTEARYWSQIEEARPTWSQVAEHTVYTVPDDEQPPEQESRFYRPEEESRSEYGIAPSRARVRSEEAGEFKNEYLREDNIDPERIKKIMNHRYRGRWIPPEFFADDRLVEDYFNAISSGRTNGEDFVTWAYHKKQAEYQQREMAKQAQKQYVRAMRAARAGHRRSRGGQPVPSPAGNPLGQYEEARLRGLAQGAELNKGTKKQQQGGYRGMYPDLFVGTNPQPQQYFYPPMQQTMPQTPPRQNMPGATNAPNYWQPPCMQQPYIQPPYMQPQGQRPPQGQPPFGGQPNGSGRKNNGK